MLYTLILSVNIVNQITVQHSKHFMLDFHICANELGKLRS